MAPETAGDVAAGSGLRSWAGSPRTVAVTGVDTAGKTTLANGLAKLGYAVTHSKFQPHTRDLFAHYAELLAGLEGNAVLDRSFITEFVYGPVLRGGSRISDAQFDRLAGILERRCGIVVYLCQDQDVLEERLHESLLQHPKHQMTLDHLGELLARYTVVTERLGRRLPTLCMKSSAAVSQARLAAEVEDLFGCLQYR